ncbi:MAG: PilZ domain-containing protein [Candidatus Schekmanbacteria bacterium]|nr:MAG: PilZ domain-containing protein [Candidatus Schekmanbacteria bacterium]
MAIVQKKIKERRSAPRVNSINLLHYNFFDQREFDKRQGIARTINISESGILIECGYPFPIHSVLEISLAIGEDLVILRGEVVRGMISDNNNYYLGLKFLKMSHRSKQIIANYILNHR